MIVRRLFFAMRTATNDEVRFTPDTGRSNGCFGGIIDFR